MAQRSKESDEGAERLLSTRMELQKSELTRLMDDANKTVQEPNILQIKTGTPGDRNKLANMSSISKPRLATSLRAAQHRLRTTKSDFNLHDEFLTSEASLGPIDGSYCPKSQTVSKLPIRKSAFTPSTLKSPLNVKFMGEQSPEHVSTHQGVIDRGVRYDDRSTMTHHHMADRSGEKHAALPINWPNANRQHHDVTFETLPTKSHESARMLGSVPVKSHVAHYAAATEASRHRDANASSPTRLSTTSLRSPRKYHSTDTLKSPRRRTETLQSANNPYWTGGIEPMHDSSIVPLQQDHLRDLQGIIFENPPSSKAQAEDTEKEDEQRINTGLKFSGIGTSKLSKDFGFADTKVIILRSPRSSRTCSIADEIRKSSVGSSRKSADEKSVRTVLVDDIIHVNDSTRFERIGRSNDANNSADLRGDAPNFVPIMPTLEPKDFPHVQSADNETITANSLLSLNAAITADSFYDGKYIPNQL